MIKFSKYKILKEEIDEHFDFDLTEIKEILKAEYNDSEKVQVRDFIFVSYKHISTDDVFGNVDYVCDIENFAVFQKRG